MPTATCIRYTPGDFATEARRAVKGLGRLLRWEVRIHDSGRVALWAFYQPRGSVTEATVNVAL